MEKNLCKATYSLRPDYGMSNEYVSTGIGHKHIIFLLNILFHILNDEILLQYYKSVSKCFIIYA